MANPAKARVLILGGGGGEGGGAPASILSVSLPHPRSGEHVIYLFVDGAPHELQRLADGAEGSWLIGESSQEDGGMLVASPIDPTFFVLARLFRARRHKVASARGARGEPERVMYEPLSDVLTDLDCRGLELLSGAPRIGERLAAAFDVNRKFDEPMVRIDEAKAISWLRAKTEQLRARRPPLLARTAASSAVCASTLVEDDGAGCLAPGGPPRAEPSTLQALSLLGDYLDDELLELVAGSYG
ncbi:Ydr279p protein family-domain-containing protein [Pavlovales sp. CCMP2436]|nr:Ydr279p protein family-domain-containing protein [Pavlovales sp. CCMP2436]